MLETMANYFSYPFVRYALIVGILIALCSSLLGVTLVLRRFSFIGDGLSHVAFGAMACAAALGLTSDMTVVLPVTVAAAILLLCTGNKSRLRGDAALAMISVAALAVGYLLMNLFSTSSNVSGDVCGSLFGSTSILTITKTELILCISMAAAVILTFVLLYNRIFAVTFDGDFAAASGMKASFLKVLLAVVTALVIVLAMKLVGSLLISALVVFPALSAMRVFRSFRAVMVCAALVSVFASAAGLLVSIAAATPVGATVVVAELICFLTFSVIGKFLGRN
ncbi:MAG: metal ABC transporter permease [Clostridia bacterium]|nr:metal ABC transporter permease [Clostridia bacterium]